MDTEGVPQLKAAKAKIDAAIEALLNKVAIYRKRSEALQHSINILLSSDDELDEITAGAPVHRGGTNCVDPDRVEKALLESMAVNYPYTLAETKRILNGKGMLVSDYMLRKVLGTCPGIDKSGDKQQTRYTLRQ